MLYLLIRILITFVVIILGYSRIIARWIERWDQKNVSFETLKKHYCTNFSMQYVLQIIPIDNPLPVSMHILSMHSREYLLVHTFMLFTFACFICRPIPLYLPAVRRVE